MPRASRFALELDVLIARELLDVFAPAIAGCVLRDWRGTALTWIDHSNSEAWNDGAAPLPAATMCTTDQYNAVPEYEWSPRSAAIARARQSSSVDRGLSSE